MSILDSQSAGIMADLQAGMSQRKVAEKHGVARSTLQDWLKSEPASAVQDVDLLQAEVTDLRKRVKQSYNIDVQAERVYREVRHAVRAEPVKYQPLDIPLTSQDGHVQALLLSDTHAGEVVVPEAVNGLNEYNWDVCVERMANIQRSLLSFQANRPYPIEELHLWVLGDMLSGSNHQELAETNEFPAAEQAYRFGMLLGQWIEELVPYYPRIKVRGIVGNHPRVSQKPANKQVFNNFDWMAYKIAEAYLAKYVEQGSLDVNFPRAGFHITEIAGNKVLLMHGDGIRSSMPGVPWGGVTRRVNELKKQYIEQGILIRGVALGHFHQCNVVQGGIFMNGSVKGTDEYSLKNFGAGEKPTQLLLTFDKQKERLTDASFINP